MRPAPRPGDVSLRHPLNAPPSATASLSGRRPVRGRTSWRSARCRWIEWHRLPSSNLRVRIGRLAGTTPVLPAADPSRRGAVRERGAHRRRRGARGTNATELPWTVTGGLRFVDGRGRGESHAVRADVVAGADGRFSFAGDAVGAPYYNVVPPQHSPSTRTSARSSRSSPRPSIWEMSRRTAR